jgi:hypothetical protein
MRTQKLVSFPIQTMQTIMEIAKQESLSVNEVILQFLHHALEKHFLDKRKQLSEKA